MKVLITGGTGFLGSQVVRQASAAGHEVVSVSRGISAPGHLYPVINKRVDLLHPDGLAHALEGVVAVAHLAGRLRETRSQSFERLNVGATANLLDACKKASVTKIVYVSALGARANATHPYLKTKWEAEETLRTSGIAYTILRPSLMFGSGDRLVSHLLSIIRYSPLVPVVAPDDARTQPIWVGDVVTAILRALAGDNSNGHTYDLGGPVSVSFSDLVDLIKAESGRVALSLPLPAPLASMLVGLEERLLPNPPFSQAQIGAFTEGGTCDPNPAAVTFGLRMRSLVDVLPEYP